MRGVAVIVVLFYHLQIPGFANGYLGVDIFFVLSGFLMAQLYDQGTAWDFYARRLKRLLPAYLVTVIVTTLAVALITVPTDANQRFDRLWFDLTGLSNIAFWMENSYFESASFKPLLNLWSLGVELQYYLIVPILLPLLRPRAWLLWLVILASLAAALVITTISPKTSFFMMPLRVWEFLLGAVAAWHLSGRGEERTGLAGSLILMGAICAIVALYPLKSGALSMITGHPGLAALLISLVTTAILARPLHRAFSAATLPGRTFVTLGDYSYSIYLVHFPIIILVNYHIFGGTNLGFQTPFHLVVILVLTAASSILMYRYVESLRLSPRIGRAVAAMMVAGLGLSLIAPPLTSARYDPQQNLIFAAWEDRDTYRCGKLVRVLNPAETTCQTNDVPGGPDVFLVGNSHADAIKRLFSDRLAESGLSVAFSVANTPLMAPETDARAVAADARRLGVSEVVIHYAPFFYFREDYRNELTSFIEMMRAEGIGVSFIAPVPTYETHIPETLFLQTVDPGLAVAGMSLAHYKEKNANFFDLIAEIAQADEPVYPTHPYLCPEGSCQLQEAGKPFYFDEGHLTLTGAQKLMPVFDEIANRLAPAS